MKQVIVILSAALLAAPAYAQSARVTYSADCKKSGAVCTKPTRPSVTAGLLHPDGSNVRFKADFCLLLSADEQDECMSTVDWQSPPKPAIPDGWKAAPPVEMERSSRAPVTVCIGVCVVNPR